MKDNELFSNNFEAFSDDLKNSFSNKEFKREVMAAIKTAHSITELNFNFIGLNASGNSAGLLRLIISNCLKSIRISSSWAKIYKHNGYKIQTGHNQSEKVSILKIWNKTDNSRKNIHHN